MSLILLAFCGLWGITAPIHFSHPQKSAVFTPQNCPHCGQKWSARRKKAPGFSPAFSPQRPKSLDFALFRALSRLPQAAFLTAVLANTSIFRQRSRTAAQRAVLRLLAGMRSAGRHGRDGVGALFRLPAQPVFSIRSAYFCLAASSSSFCICRS